MLIEGEKYACEACVRGHRVSSCNHSDRPLQHINKKGRPVSQCPHCRGLRKSRSSHVKCECGDKGGAGSGDKHDLNDIHSCSCVHGQRCTCAAKKEHLESVPENPLPARVRSRAHTDTRKPRLSATYSDPSITQFANGHHKPVHRLNHAGHDCAPYKIPRPHSIHGSSSLFARSHDGLPMPDPNGSYPAFLADSLMTLQSEEQRLVRSAQGSPGLNPLAKFEQCGGLPPLDLSYTAYNTSLTSSPAADDYNPTYQNFESYTTPSEDQAPLSAPLAGPSYSWTALDLPLGGGGLTSAPSQPPSYASLDQSHLSRPELTTASSADVSELGDLTAQGLPSPGYTEGSPYLPQPQSLENTVTGPYNLSTESFPTSNASATAATAVMNSSNFDVSSIDSFPQPSQPQPSVSPFDPTDLSIKPDPEAFTRHGLKVQDMQKMAHPLGALSAEFAAPSAAAPASPLTAAPTSDPAWAAAYSSAEDVDFPSPGPNTYQDGWLG